MDALDLARWQFGITTVYHFIFVPLTIGLAPLVAIMQTIWVRTGDEKWLKLTKFFGKLLLINFAIGVATGIVQEFQFGMNWSEYSRFVGDVFGAPLAMEALAAFFVESTFLPVDLRPTSCPRRSTACIQLSRSRPTSRRTSSSRRTPGCGTAGMTFNPRPAGPRWSTSARCSPTTPLLAAFPHTITAAF